MVERTCGNTRNITTDDLFIDLYGGVFGKNGIVYEPKMPPYDKNIMNHSINGLFYLVFIPRMPP